MPIDAMIQGKTVDSNYELNFARSLDKYGWNYDYQHPLFGGRDVLGGTIVDFMVDTVPLPTPVYLEAKYWHSGQRSERDKVLYTLIAARLRKYYATPRTFGTADVATQEDSDRTVLREFGRMG